MPPIDPELLQQLIAQLTQQLLAQKMCSNARLRAREAKRRAPPALSKSPLM